MFSLPRFMVRGNDQQQEQVGGAWHEVDCWRTEDLHRLRRWYGARLLSVCALGALPLAALISNWARVFLVFWGDKNTVMVWVGGVCRNHHDHLSVRLCVWFCAEDIFWAAQHFVTKLGMVVHYCGPECRAKKLAALFKVKIMIFVFFYIMVKL